MKIVFAINEVIVPTYILQTSSLVVQLMATYTNQLPLVQLVVALEVAEVVDASG